MSKSLITKQALASSLKKLTKQMNFDKITVAHITSECGLNRQTFYYHFEDKIQLLHWIYDNELFILAEDISFENWNDKFLEMLKLIKKDKQFYMHTIKCSNDYFEKYLLDILQQIIVKGIVEIEPDKELAKSEMELLSRFFAHGLCGIVIEWTINGMTVDENEFSDMLNKLVVDSLDTLHRRYVFLQKFTGV